MKKVLVNGFIIFILSRIMMWFMVGLNYTEPISYETKMIVSILLWVAAMIVVLIYLLTMVISYTRISVAKTDGDVNDKSESI